MKSRIPNASVNLTKQTRQDSIVGDGESSRCPHREATGRYCVDCELLDGCRWFLLQLDERALVRNIEEDSAPDWGLRMAKFVMRIKRVKEALAQAEQRKGI